MVTEIGLLGPLAAVYGREIEQLLMQEEMPELIPVDEFAYSVERGRASLKTVALKSSYQEHYAGSNQSESDRQSRGSTRRTRSPRLRDVRDVRDVQDVRDARDTRYDSRGIPRDVRDRRY